MRGLAALLAAVMSVTVGACGYVMRIRGPDGKDNWFAIEQCGSRVNCYETASKLCPQGYTMADGSGHVDMLIQCKKADSAATSATASAAPVAAPSPAADDEDAHCSTIFSRIEDTADLWVEWFHVKPATDMPKRRTFDRVCGDLDEDVQFCLAADYARAHHDACLAKLQALPKPTRDALDAMFSAPSATPPQGNP